MSRTKLIRLLEGATSMLRQLSGQARRAACGGRGPWRSGRPNVGKSSLMNALLKADRAIVTPVPGTTRDMLEEVVSLDGIPVRLFDTAGIRSTDDVVEAEGIRRSHLAWEEADLALILLDGSQPLSESDRVLLARQEAAQALLVINKCDLDRRLLKEELVRACPSSAGVIDISAKMQVGLDGLRAAIRSRLTPDRLEAQDCVPRDNIRHARRLTGLCRVSSKPDARSRLDARASWSPWIFALRQMH